MQLAVSFQYRVEDVSAIDAAPAFEPPVATAFLEIEEVIPCHASLTPLTSHWDLLCSGHASSLAGRAGLVETQMGYPKRGRAPVSGMLRVTFSPVEAKAGGNRHLAVGPTTLAVCNRIGRSLLAALDGRFADRSVGAIFTAAAIHTMIGGHQFSL
jgi:hypothetical protein